MLGEVVLVGCTVREAEFEEDDLAEGEVDGESVGRGVHDACTTARDVTAPATPEMPKSDHPGVPAVGVVPAALLVTTPVFTQLDPPPPPPP